MEQLNNLDVVFLIIVGISALVGIARGMTKEILSVCGWVLAAVAVFYLTPVCNQIMKNYIASDILSNIVSGMCILIIFCIVWILVEDKISAVIRQSKLSALDRLFGFVFGAARGALIVVLIALMVSTLLPESSESGVFGKSKIFKEASLYVEPLKSMIPQSWIDSVKAKTESLGLGKTDEKTSEKDSDEKADNKANDKANDKVNDLDKTTESENKDNVNETVKEQKKESSDLKENLDVLQKTGEELFNKLAQPQPAGNAESSGEPAESDLDKLLDVLEDKIVTSDTKNDALPDSSKQVSEKVIDVISENVANKVVAKQAAKETTKNVNK